MSVPFPAQGALVLSEAAPYVAGVSVENKPVRRLEKAVGAAYFMKNWFDPV